jgi:hypothetical protein
MAIDRAPAPPSATLPGDLSLAGWFDLLERADALPRRRRPARAAVTRAPRGLRPLPVARPVPVPRPRPVPPAAAAPAVPVPAPAPARPVAGSRLRARLRDRLRARLRATVRRLAMWGAGPGGAHAAWPTPPVVVPPAGPGLVRRLALWGAGPGGAHLAWGAPRPAVPAGNGPVVLTELPSTPTIAPAVSSPTVASRPPGAAGPVLPRPAAGPVLAPAGWPARPATTRPPTGRPLARAPDRPVQAGAGAVRTRGDPAPHAARGSPRPPPAPD